MFPLPPPTPLPLPLSYTHTHTLVLTLCSWTIAASFLSLSMTLRSGASSLFFLLPASLSPPPDAAASYTHSTCASSRPSNKELNIHYEKNIPK